MPYSGEDDKSLPDYVKGLPDDERAQWVEVFNSAYTNCIDDDGEEDACEASAFKQANGVVMKGDGGERAVSIQSIFSQVFPKLESIGMYPIDLYSDGATTFAIATRDGKLYKIPISVGANDEIELGESQQVMIDFPAIEGRGLSVVRQADGRYRWTAIACTAVLNRSGEIDTTKLFDNFVSRAETEGYPQLDFYHITGTDMGQADYLAREGYTLLASGLFEDSPVGRAAADGLMTKQNYWGCSILYSPIKRELMRIGDIELPVYEDGVLRKITILPEAEAAALFTTMEVERMNDKIKLALRTLIGDELADEMEKRIDGVNKRVKDDGMIARTEKPATETQGPVPVVLPADPVLQEPVPNEVESIVRIRGEIAEMKGRLDIAIETIKTLAEVMESRLAGLERTDDERKRAWLLDLPEKKLTPPVQVWRPRDQQAEGRQPEPANVLADRILQSKKK